MTARKQPKAAARPPAPDPPPRPREVRLPGFLVSEEVGMGDVIKKATAWAGVKPCGGCNKRAAALNRRVTFTPRGRQ